MPWIGVRVNAKKGAVQRENPYWKALKGLLRHFMN